MIIMCDIDEILNDLVPKTLTMYNAQSGKDIQISDLTSYKWNECLPEEDSNAMIALLNDKALYDTFEPLPDSQWGLKTLINQGHDVYLATATPFNNFAWKVEWVEKYFPFVDIRNIICIRNKGLLKCDVMIDDCLANLTSNICERVVLDYPWNRSTSKDYAYDIHRCYNWVDIVNTINELERKEKEWEKK